MERLYPERFEQKEVEVRKSPERKHTNLEKAMGIVPDDRPKEKTSFGIKTYKKTEQTLVHADDKGIKEIRRLGKTQVPFNHSNLDYVVPSGVKQEADSHSRSNSRDVSKTF